MMDRQSLARPYARAFHDHARAHGVLDLWGRFLEAGAALVADARVRGMLADPRRTPSEKLTLLACLLDIEDEARRRACGLLLEHRRFALLPAIATEFRALRARDEGWIDVEVTTPHAVRENALDPLARALEARWARRPRIRLRTEPNLLAGAEIRVGDTVLDASLRGRLARLAAAVS